MRLPFRQTRVLALGLAMAAVPTAALVSGAPATTAAVVTAAPQIPDSPAGRQLSWFLDAVPRAPIPAAELEEHLNAEFLKAIPADDFNAFVKGLKGLTLEKLTTVQPTTLVGLASVGGHTYVLTIAVDGEGRINALRLDPGPAPVPPAPSSWTRFDARLKKAAPETGSVTAEIDTRGRCEVVHGKAADKPRPLASIFKLYVLGAVAEKIRDGGLSWDTKLTIKPEWKSTGQGGLVDRPDNSTTTVHEAAKLMISISDNTAADILIHTVGRKAVEAKVRAWSGHAKENIPFLTTRELFLLKGVNYPAQAKAYLALSPARKLDYLQKTVAGQSLSDIKVWTTPRENDTLEWFGSPRDVCRAYAGLVKLNSKQLNETLAANDGSLKLDPARWPTVWFKGGSEVGLLNMSYLARSAKGRVYVVTTLTADPKAAIDENTAAPELISLSRGAFALVKTG
ncbi:serine hydrolase [Streptosporangium sp. NBC_01756]|uniref:serine hydrolase n=1 Tax=Streptosporangium sp. NBC_01756 TaxID=2975950 RepID=UPI002DD8FAEF|nr:serine hydrolase [Streptosporangium sp. NBC_01756]WSC88453.1 serine hydrolase [Streptosporangium sp. NBC_01756]